MTVEANIYSALKALVGNRVFPDMAPLSTVKPYITYSQIGGEALTYLEAAVPSKQNGRFQFNVWGDTRSQCSALMLEVEAALVGATTIQAKPIDAPSSAYEHDMLMYGSMQDFSIWSDR
jgi:hypothetical protein